MMPSPLLAFDLDGTLADTAPDLLSTLAVVLPRHGIRYSPDPDLRNGIGHGARALIEHALRREDVSVEVEQLDALHRDFLAYYEANICNGTELFPGTLALLDRFATAGWRLAVCTNKPERMSRLLLQRLGVAGRFSAICGGDSFGHRKPDPRHLLDTIDDAAASPDRAVMVGDSRTDLETARGCGIPFVGVTFGYTPEPMAALSPDLLIESFDELTPAVAATLLSASAATRRSPAVEAVSP